MSHQHDGKKNGKRHSPDTSHPSVMQELPHENAPTTQPRDDGRDNEHNSNERKPSPSEKVMTICTGIIAFCTVIYSVFAGLQWWEIYSGGQDTHTAAVAADLSARTAYAAMFLNKRLNEQTLGEMQKQSEAMRDAATAGGNQAAGIKESNRINRESLEAVQRAFISFAYVDTDRLKGDDSFYLEFRPWFQNSGTTPAQVVARYFGSGRNGEPSEAEFIGKNARVAYSFGPKESRPLELYRKQERELFGLDLGERYEHIGEIKPVNNPLILWGWIAYRDVFPQTKLHITEFCQATREPRLGPKGIIFQSRGCPSHNCTDENCPDYKQIVKIANSANSNPSKKPPNPN